MNIHMVFAVDPLLATWGQVAAIIICVYILVFVLIALGFNLAMAFGLAWVHEKIQIVKMLRPSVDSVNKTTELSLQGTPPSVNENPVVRTIADVPVRVQAVDKRVEQTADRVASSIIEFRSRTVQAKTILKAFFLPGLSPRKELKGTDGQALEFKSPGYRMLMEEKAPEVPVEAEAGAGYAQTVAASQLKDVPAR